MKHSIWVSIFVMAGVSYLIRVLPLTLIRKPIKNTFIRSFLYYVPYITLTVMTFPAILKATGSPLAGGIAFLTGIIITWRGAGLLQTAVVCCAAVYILQLFL
ncbi:MAG: AzlD domain-containing protein [Solobacterium sp.]|nr:AzlD domain-containing protein [Solobacterium sp.]